MGNARYHLTEDVMLYARVATEFRPGSGCSTCFNLIVPEAPPIVNPDKTTNYEVGIKGALLDRRLQFSLGAFTIDWTDIQVNVVDKHGNQYGSNAGHAR